MKLVSELVHDEAGAALTEYAMLLALIAVAVVGALGLLHDSIVSVFNKGTSTLKSASK